MIEPLLERLTKALHSRRIPYMIIEGQAVLFYGSPRLTQDVDVTLGIDIDGYEKIIDVCQRAKLKILTAKPNSFLRQTHVLPTQDWASKLRVDFIFSNTSYERNAIRRARSGKVGSVNVKFASLEDLIVHKLVAGRALDIEDVQTLLAKHKSKLDTRYVRRWLRRFAALNLAKDNPLKVFDRLI